MSSLPVWARNLGNTADALFVVDSRQRIVYWNDGAEALFGYSAAEVLHEHCYDMIAGRACPGKAWCHSNCRVQRAMRKGVRHRNFDLVVRTKDGKELYTNVTIILLMQRKVSLSVHIARDITRLARDKEAVQAILDALRLTGCTVKSRGAEHPPDREGSQHDVPLSNLTRREVEILSLLAEGLPAIAIARRLYISPFTVRNHIQNTLEKLRLHNKAQAVSFAFRNGLV